jgi:hypothetical protein
MMSSMAISWIVFGVVFGGAILGMLLRALLPEHHLSQESKDVVKVGMGLIGTIAALVLGLLVASAKSSFDAQRSGLVQLSANLILLDRILAHYGPEAKGAREQLKENVSGMLKQMWPQERDGSDQGEPTSRSESLYEQIQDLSPKTDSQRTIQNTALSTAVQIGQARWLLFAQKTSSVPTPFLVVLVFWLAVIFASFSMFARPNTTVVVALLLAALSVSGAIFLILELDHPFDGLIQLSSDPLQRALAQMGR